MIFTHLDKTKLPTLKETLSIFGDVVNQLPKVQLTPWDSPSDAEFILTRTKFAYSIKPNILRNSVLFMGCPYLKHLLHG